MPCKDNRMFSVSRPIAARGIERLRYRNERNRTSLELFNQLGKIGKRFRGDHEPILDVALFAAVQAKLSAQAVERRCRIRVLSDGAGIRSRGLAER
jgi:hypothetical protein